MRLTRPTVALAVASVTLATGCSAAAGRTVHQAATSPAQSTSSASAPAVSSQPASPSASVTSAAGAPTFALTGLPATTAAAAAKTSLAIKVDNVSGAWPQAGLNQADIVVDTPVEGGLTRLFAVYQSQGAPLVGPVRSARPVDGDLLRLLGGGYFAYSGANAGEIAPVQANSTAVLMSFDADNTLFIKRGDHASPHNVFATTDSLYARGSSIRPGAAAPHAIFTFSPTPATGPATSDLLLRFPSASAAWHWDGHQYVRTQDGHADMLMDGTQVTATNVLVMSVGLRDSGVRDSLHHAEPWPQTIGGGTCCLTAPLVLHDGNGQVIALAPGRTWVELAPTGTQPQFS
jgi:hypothetical protein